MRTCIVVCVACAAERLAETPRRGNGCLDVLTGVVDVENTAFRHRIGMSTAIVCTTLFPYKMQLSYRAVGDLRRAKSERRVRQSAPSRKELSEEFLRGRVFGHV